MERPETTKMKKSWCEPALIVLVRGKPEEAILSGCKFDASGVGAGSLQEGCNNAPSFCAGCNSITQS